MHEQHFQGVGLQKGPHRCQNPTQIAVEINNPIVNFQLVLLMATAYIQGTHADEHLVSQRVALCLEGVAPSPLAHGGVRADNGQFAERNAAVELAHPVRMAQARRFVAVELQRQGQAA